MSEIWREVASHWFCLGAMGSLAACALRMRALGRVQAAERWRERRLREELEAYARVDTSMAAVAAGGHEPGEPHGPREPREPKEPRQPHEPVQMLAKRLCRVIAEKSAFERVAVLLRDADGRLYCAGWAGVDDLTVKALDDWGRTVVEEERTGVRGGISGGKASGAGPASRAGAKSFSIPLGEWGRYDREVAAWALSGKRERRRWRRALVAPIRTGTGKGKLAGAVVVCADGPRNGAREGYKAGLERAMGPIEALAARVAGSLENEVLHERLGRAEKLAGLGQLAGGVAHALNNPLTAVLGFAELITEATGDARVRQDAETIRAEALKMRDTVQRLVEFWRPVTAADEAVELPALIDELSRACRETLLLRGVRLEVSATGATPPVRGNRDRLRQVLEQLLNNSAHAIATAQGSAAGQPEEDLAEGHAIRITVTDDGQMLHLIVSDTGPGFVEPGRVFDPFYTTKGPEGGAGMGLSICYGIVREHGGEISAFNLHPRGAAVVVELPVRRAVAAGGTAESQASNVLVMEERLRA